MPTTFATIVTLAGLARARVLAEDVAVAHPASPALVALVLDDRDGVLDAADEPFEVVRPGDLGLDAFEMLAGACGDPAIVGAVLGPALLRSLFERDAEGVAVLLPDDATVLAPLDPLVDAAAAAGAGVALVPRVREPIPVDGLEPTDVQLCANGLIDRTCLALRPTLIAQRLLTEWERRMVAGARDGWVGPALRWLDLVATTGRAAICDDPGIALAPWNAHDRLVAVLDGVPHADGRPLRLARHPREQTLGDLARPDAWRPLRPEHEALRRDYEQRLERAGERELAEAHPYGWSRLADGTPIDARLRRAIRIAWAQTPITDPFSPEGGAALCAWLAEPAHPEFPGITRYWRVVREDRLDLQFAFPDPDGADAAPFAAWIAEHGAREEQPPMSVLAAT